MIKQFSFVGRDDIEYVFVSGRNNPNIELPPDTRPVRPDDEYGPPVETLPAKRRRPEDQPDPPPITEPNPDEPTRLV